MTKKTTLLCILDGWGKGVSAKNNAIENANTPNWDFINKTYPKTILGASGLDVGLPEGQMGNSEVGHMSIGSGRVIMQSLPKIDTAINDGSLAQKPAILELVEGLKSSKKSCHIMGLVSDGGVHAHIDHIIALAKITSNAGIKTYIHAFLDGRDTAPETAGKFIKKLQSELGEYASVATISGRYYAMDRDNRWERVELAYDAIALGQGAKEADAISAIEKSIASSKTDEFVYPVVIGDYKGMEDSDGLIMANFRSDRARQILSSFIDPDFDDFEPKKIIDFSAKIGMVKYSDRLNSYIKPLFTQDSPTNTLGEVIAQNGLSQLRISETEKYAHITFFFNGGIEDTFDNEDRILVPSPKVATYDEKPEMSAFEVTDKLIEAINSKKYDLIIVNFANTDMVGHTGIFQAAVKAAQAVDKSLGRLIETIKIQGGIMLVTADHGNAELMINPKTHEPHTQHTLNPVPFLVINEKNDIKLKKGKLCDIAPTILKLMNLNKPDEMTGEALF